MKLYNGALEKVTVTTSSSFPEGRFLLIIEYLANVTAELWFCTE